MSKLKGVLLGGAVAFFMSATLVSGAIARAAASCPAIEIARVVQPGTIGSRTFSGPRNETVTVEKASLATVRDVTKSNISFAEGVWGLGLHLSSAAAERMRSYTTAHVGDQLAFIVQDRAKMVVKILDPIMGDEAWISPFDKQEAEALAANINACAAPKR